MGLPRGPLGRRALAGLSVAVLVALLTAAPAPGGEGDVPPPDWRWASWERPAASRGAPRPPIPRAPKRSWRLEPGAWVPGQLVVAFRRYTTGLQATHLHRAVGARAVRRLPALRFDLVRLPPGLSVPRAVARYRRDPAVLAAEPNFRRHRLQVVPTDPRFGEQWGLHNVGQPHGVADPPPETVEGAPDADVDAPEAWAVTTGSPETVIAVIDSGVDLSHPDLAGSLWVNPDEVPGNGVDDDSNGFVDDVNGWDFEEQDPVPQDEDGHGTHVAGIIAAAAGNGVGGAGVCPGCRLMVLKAPLDLFGELAAIEYAVLNGADVLNLSFSGAYFSVLERRTLAWAGSQGVLAVAAAGNEGGDNDMPLDLDVDLDGVRDCCPVYPASYDLPTVVAVAASNDLDEYGSFTNLGHESVDLAAPGVDVLSTYPPGDYRYLNGTSMAAPFVAGVAGLVKSAHPEYGPLELRNAILNGVDRPAGLGYVYLRGTEQFPGSFTLTDGRLDAAQALTAPTTPPTGPSDGNISGARLLRAAAMGSVGWPEDVNDVFRKRLLGGRAYTFRLEVPRGQNFDLYLWKPGTLEIWQCRPGLFSPCRLARSGTRGRGRDEAFVFRPRRTGTYYVHVSAWFSRGSYRLSVTSG
ncbi:MAG TPA: S8 family peptidase [Actinomycetota bacterium]|nr:S8 family peptidase [Actinomycetota bacterium]